MDVDQQKTCKKSYIHIVLSKHVVRLNYFRIIVLCQWFADGGILSPRNSGQPVATLFLFINFFFFGHAGVFIAVCRPSLVVAGRGYSLLAAHGWLQLLRQLLLLQNTGSRHAGSA